MNFRLAGARIHFIGVGGVGMCGLAELLYNMGVQVKGSDLSENSHTHHLRQLGIKISIGHNQENLRDVDVAVFSSAVKPSNIEYQTAKRLGIPLIPRAEALAEIMQLRRGIAIAGSHGKTTTTSMTATIFIHAKTDPTIVIGGRLDLIKSTAKLGSGEWLIAEADESDGSFNRLTPEIAIVTNIDNDHLDHFGSLRALENAFVEFASRIPFYGVAIVCGDSPRMRELFEAFPKRILFYGFDAANEYRIEGKNSQYRLYYCDHEIGGFKLQIPGRHNALNATAAILAGHVSGLPLAKCFEGIATYSGVDRRFHKKANVLGIDIYDDYGHHPTEISAVISAFREQFPKRRLVILFQPHRFSRTRQCWDQFLNCFENCDKLYLCDIYPAGEMPIAGVSAQKLLEEIRHSDRCYLGAKNTAGAQIVQDLRPGDVFVTLGAGDVWKIGEEVADKLQNKSDVSKT